MQWPRILLATLFISFKASAIDDAIFLADIVANTTQELVELERLITKTTQNTKKIAEFADTIDDYTYRAERLKSWGEELRDLSGEDANNLEEINSLLRQIRMIEESTENLYYEYAKRHLKNERNSQKYKDIAKRQIKNTKDYKKQALRSQRNSAASMQQVAQNTATIAYEQSKTNMMFAEQNKKLAELYALILEKEKRELEKQHRVNRKYKREIEDER